MTTLLGSDFPISDRRKDTPRKPYPFTQEEKSKIESFRYWENQTAARRARKQYIKELQTKYRTQPKQKDADGTD